MVSHSPARHSSILNRYSLTICFLALVATGIVGPADQCSWSADTTLVTAGSVWRYLDDGTNQGSAWTARAFNDAAWRLGPAQLGYGDSDEATVVSYGPDVSNKYVTTYFRHSFPVSDPSIFASLNLRVLRDDGAVVYLNGVEVFRTNMPAGTLSYTTPASTALGGTDETTFVQTTLNASALVSGTNVLAVEIHQANGTSTDVSFDLALTASASVSVIRGPYLQVGTPTSIRVRWRTNAPVSSVVNYGTDPANLTGHVEDAALVTEHELALTGLTPDTLYYYTVGTYTGTLAGGSDYLFYTAPSSGPATPVRVWVTGDMGWGGANPAAVRDAYISFTGTRYTDVWLTLGDNEQHTGLDSDYQWVFFDMYPNLLRQVAVRTAIGNHDVNGSSNPPPDMPYYANFTLPSGGEAGGIASGTEDYYSYDFANIHFICLDSVTSSRGTTGPMLTWLVQDLAANDKQWVIAYWHYPPYTKAPMIRTPIQA